MYEQLKAQFAEVYGAPAKYLFSAPGRTELSGNHTDHQHGCVLAAAVNLETVAAVRENDGTRIRVLSQGYPMCEIALDDLTVHPEENGTTAALIRGVAARFAQLGKTIKGFDACVQSGVLPGSGLSSSAAFEVLMGVIINHLGNAGLTAPEIAMAGQYAENVYFGKPCGLMDQTASSVGNAVRIDFGGEQPVIEPIRFDFSACGHALCIIDSGADHADLTDEYAAIPGELEKVCTLFGAEVLRDVPEDKFYEKIASVRRFVGDRAMLRAIHIYEENRRVEAQTQALQRGDFGAFLQLMKLSGYSSWMYLQNVIPAGNTDRQELAFALAVTEHLLGGRGACRVHGGGFAGTLQAFVPYDILDEFREKIEKVLGEGHCHVLAIRPQGGILLEEL